MGLFANTDGQFHRAVDIVQSLPKGGPVQTSYEEKLWLYSLYKQATEGDIAIPRPGILDILGKAKWDAWNKQKGIDKQEAKRLYVNALLKILRKHSDSSESQTHISELESFTANQGGSENTFPPRPVSPASSSSSYHSSQASPISLPPPERHYKNMLPPDPSLPPPDVAEDIVPPSALTSSHRSLLNLSQAQSPSSIAQPPTEPNYMNNIVSHIASRTHSLIGGVTGKGVSGDNQGERQTGGSLHSFRQNQRPIEPSYPAVPPRNTNLNTSIQHQQHQQMPMPIPYSPNLPSVRDYVNIPTPEFGNSPYLGVGQGGAGNMHIQHGIGNGTGTTPIINYPSRIQGPGSTSTFTQAPLNLSINLQNIQTSLSALHERLSILERNQSFLLRKNNQRKHWFWNQTEEDELDQLEDDLNDHNNGQNQSTRNGHGNENRSRDLSNSSSHITITRVKKRKSKLSIRIMWYLLTTVRRALIDVSIGMIVMIATVIVLGGGWRRARWTLGVLQARFQRYLTDGL